MCARLVDHAGCGEFFALRVFCVAKTKEKLLRLAGAQLQMELHCADRRPAVRDGTGAAPGGDSLRQGGGAVGANEGVPYGRFAQNTA